MLVNLSKIKLNFLRTSIVGHPYQWRIQGECPVHAPGFFYFDLQNFRNVTASGVDAHPFGKSWICHCLPFNYLLGPLAKFGQCPGEDEIRVIFHSTFSEMNLPNFAKVYTFYRKYFKLSSKCSQYRFKAFYNEIKNLILNFDTFKRF